MRSFQYLRFGLACTFVFGVWPHTVAAKQTILLELNGIEQVGIHIESQKAGVNQDLPSELRRYSFEANILRELQVSLRSIHPSIFYMKLMDP
jgi:hypothetical protein